jgi:hypothetical protein
VVNTKCDCLLTLLVDSLLANKALLVGLVAGDDCLGCWTVGSSDGRGRDQVEIGYNGQSKGKDRGSLHGVKRLIKGKTIKLSGWSLR